MCIPCVVVVVCQSDEGSGAMGQAVSGLEGLTSSFRDLSAWRVSIPRVEQRVDSANKPYYAFIVDVTRIDVSGGLCIAEFCTTLTCHSFR